MAKQKTWTDLFGPFNKSAQVFQNEIVLHVLGDRWIRLWVFDSHERAEQCFSAWKSEQ